MEINYGKQSFPNPKGYKKQLKDLQKQIIDMKIEQHRKGYIHIPFSWKRLGLFGFTLLSGLIAYLNFILLMFVGKAFKVWTLLGSSTPEKEFSHWSQLIILYPLIGEYILIGLTIICLIAMIKGGFDKLKMFDDDGLIFGLIVGLIVGLISWLICGIIVGLIFGLISWLIFGLIVVLIFGLRKNLRNEVKQ